MRRAIASLLASLLAGPLAAATPFTLDDFYLLERVAEPVFDPAGERLAYSVTTNHRKADESTSDLWTVPWSGGDPRPLTRTPTQSEWQPRFSADGRSVFFLSDAGKDDIVQLWRMPAQGGRARKVTNLPGGVLDYDLSPDGRHAAVIAEVGLRVGHQGDVPPPIETDRFLFKRDGDGYLDDRTQQLFVVELSSGKERKLTTGERDHWHPAWSPDGKSIAYTAKDRGETDRDLNYEVYVQPLDGEPRRVSTFAGADNDPDWLSKPAWSPDSRRLVWLEGGEDKWIYYAPTQLVVADVATGALTRPARIDRFFYVPRFADADTLLALVEQDRDTWLARIELASGEIEYLTSGPRLAYDFAVAANGRIALLDTDVRTPAELIALDGGRRLTNHNAWITQREFGEVRDVSFASGDISIHGYVTLPPGSAARRLPLVVDIHGGPVYQHSHEFNLEARLYAAAGYAVLAPNPRGSSGRGFDFSRAIYADWGTLDGQDISAGISHAIDSGLADPARVGVVGWSYGGILTDYLIASEPRIRAAVSGAGVANVLATFGVDQYVREYIFELGTPWANFETWRRLASPFLHPDRIRAPTLFQCASKDDNVPCVGAEQMYQVLKTLGVPTRLIVYPDENHSLTVPSYLVHRMASNLDWFDRWLRRP